jgi:hypothetical protein
MPADEKEKHIKQQLWQKIMETKPKNENYNDDNLLADAPDPWLTQNLLIEARLGAMTGFPNYQPWPSMTPYAQSPQNTLFSYPPIWKCDRASPWRKQRQTLNEEK